MLLNKDDIRAAGGIVHSDGNVFFTNIDQLNAALLDKLLKGVELPEALGDGFTALVIVGDTPSLMEQKRICVSPIAVCSLESAIQYGAAQRLAGQQRETCTWTEQDDKDMPCTYESSCGEMWSFTDGGLKENRVTYCHHCGGKVVPASPQEQT